VGWKTWAGFALSVGAATAVVTVLPSWVRERKAPQEPRAAAAPAPEAPAPPVALRELALDKTRAEKARAKATRLSEALERQEAVQWGGEDYRDALSRLARGDEAMAARDYRSAAEIFEDASRRLEAVASRAAGLVTDRLARAGAALEGGRAHEARELFSFVLAIEPDNPAAASGLARAETLDEVFSLVAAGEELERRGALDEAAERYRRAASLDPRFERARSALARAEGKASDQAFSKAMSEAIAALGRKDLAPARAAFERARGIRPDSSEAAAGLARVAEEMRSREIAEHRDRARDLEAREAWSLAEKEYEAVLALDPAIRFAQEGTKRAGARALLASKLDYQIAHPERLSDASALREASRLLEEARGIEQSGPEHSGRIERLEAIVRSYSTVVAIEILSDNLTEVTVYRVGRLGKFQRRSLELRPGRYTVVGSRDGYRDVRYDLIIGPGKPPTPITVRCEEKI
jgi:tetratricopeptide (TPR) repeat protein